MDLNATLETSGTFSSFVETTTTGPLANSTTTFWNYGTPWYVTYPDNKTERAYQVIRALMRAKVIQVKTLNQFFAVMDEVVKVL